MLTQKEINKYIKEIKKQLLYGTRETKQFLKELKQNISDYAEENQTADMAQITEQFGKPEDIAATFFEQYGEEDIKKRISIRRVVVTAIVAAIVIFAVTIITVIIDSNLGSVDKIIVNKAIEFIEDETTTLSSDINSAGIQT